MQYKIKAKDLLQFETLKFLVGGRSGVINEKRLSATLDLTEQEINYLKAMNFTLTEETQYDLEQLR